MKFWQHLKDLWLLPARQKELEARQGRLDAELKDILAGIGDVSYLMDMVSNKELALSELGLQKVETLQEDYATLEQVNEAIEETTSLKSSYETSPAIGGRMIRTKNRQLAATNTRLEELYRIKGRLTRES